MYVHSATLQKMPSLFVITIYVTRKQKVVRIPYHSQRILEHVALLLKIPLVLLQLHQLQHHAWETRSKITLQNQLPYLAQYLDNCGNMDEKQ